jgi:hypothetical protein
MIVQIAGVLRSVVQIETGAVPSGFPQIADSLKFSADCALA